MPRFIALDQLQQFTAVELLSDPGHIGGPMVIQNCAQIVFHWTLTGGKSGANVFAGRYTGAFAGTVAQANAIMTAITTGAPAATLFGHFATTAGISSVTIRDLGVANSAIISSTTPGQPSTGVGNAMPNEVALVVTKRTAATGPANRGRIYIPGWVVGSVAADNTAIAAVVTDLQAWANTLQNAFNASGYQMTIAQPARAAYTGSTGTQHPARAANQVTVQSLQVRDNHFDSQRRRGLK
jgi:hypothetical protein